MFLALKLTSCILVALLQLSFVPDEFLTANLFLTHIIFHEGKFSFIMRMFNHNVLAA